MSTLAAQGHRVLFLENTGVRAPQRPRSAARAPAHPQLVARHQGVPRRAAEPVRLLAAACCRCRIRALARWINRFLLLRALRRWMRATGFYRPIVWTFLPTPLALDLIAALDPAADDLLLHRRFRVELAGRAADRRERSSSCSSEADLVFVTSEKLRQRAAAVQQRACTCFRSASASSGSSACATAPTPPPADIAALPRPIVGYVGGLHQWVDQELVAGGRRAACPTSTFALVGPAQTDVSTLERCPNMQLLGQRPHAEVPAIRRRASTSASCRTG